MFLNIYLNKCHDSDGYLNGFEVEKGNCQSDEKIKEFFANPDLDI